MQIERCPTGAYFVEVERDVALRLTLNDITSLLRHLVEDGVIALTGPGQPVRTFDGVDAVGTDRINLSVNPPVAERPARRRKAGRPVLTLVR